MDFPEGTERFTLTIVMLAQSISSAGFSDWGCVFPVSRTMASCNFAKKGCEISFYVFCTSICSPGCNTNSKCGSQAITTFVRDQ